MRKILFFILTSFLWSACSDNDEPKKEIPVESSEITLLAYFIANASNIEDDIWTNIAAMYDGLTLMQQSATLLIYWDGSGSYGTWSNPVVLRYETDGKGNINGQKPLPESALVEDVVAQAEVIKEYPSQLSTDKNVMTRILKDMIGFSPTSRVGLIAASHGSAWTNSIFTSRGLSRSFGQDGKGTDNTMLIEDMADAIEDTGKNFDFLMFDACFMGTIEVLYELNHTADYFITSVMEVPAYGFPYENSISYLYEGTVDGYKKICNSYLDFYKERYLIGNQAWGTISLIDSKGIVPLINLIKQEIQNHTDILSDYVPYELQEYGREGGADIAYDLREFIKDLNRGTIPNDFSNQLNETVLYKGCLTEARPSNYAVDAENYCGLGIYIPVSSRPDWNDYFKTIDWFNASGWNEVTFAWNF